MSRLLHRLWGVLFLGVLLCLIVPNSRADEAADYAYQQAQAQREREEYQRQCEEAQRQREEYQRQCDEAQRQREQAERDQQARDESYRQQEQAQRDRDAWQNYWDRLQQDADQRERDRQAAQQAQKAWDDWQAERQRDWDQRAQAQKDRDDWQAHMDYLQSIVDRSRGADTQWEGSADGGAGGVAVQPQPRVMRNPFVVLQPGRQPFPQMIENHFVGPPATKMKPLGQDPQIIENPFVRPPK